MALKQSFIAFCLILFTGLCFASNPGGISTTPLLWFDGADTSTIVTTNYGVTTWRDKSGNNYDAACTSNLNQPNFLASGINNLGSIHFENNDYLVVPNQSFDHLNDNTIICVFRLSNSANDAAIFGRDYNYGNAIIRFFNGQLGYEIGNLNLGLDNFISIPEPQIGKIILITGEFYSPFHMQILCAYGEVVATANFNGDLAPHPQDQVAIGRYMDINGNGQRSLNGDIAEIIVYNSALSDSDRAAVENYLIQKWGIAVVYSSIKGKSILTGHSKFE